MRPLEIYVHIPFCVQKCAYCDFLSFPASEETQNRYTEALKEEISQWEDRGDDQVSTVFFGGGTPSVLDPRRIAELMDALRQKFSFARDAEVSMECNPGTLTPEKARIYRAAGINRISMGLQSAQDEELKSLGRIHTYGQFLKSYELVRNAGFANINVDLMSGLPGQTKDAWEDTLRRVLKLRPEHISAYSLIIEEGTPFFERYGEDAKRREQGEACRFLPSEEEERQMYERTKEMLEENGYLRYEISNYALPGFACRHNCGYWERAEYKGFGLGAASLIGNTRFSNTSVMEKYLQGEWTGGAWQKLSVQEQMEETMFLGLRMMKGVDCARFADTFGKTVQEVYGPQLKKFCVDGLLKMEDECVHLTERGIDISNYVMSGFLF